MTEWYLPSQWVVITGYYAIALAALSSLARINYRSKNHTATVVAMETFFVKKELLEGQYLDTLENVQLEKGKIGQLEIVREGGEIAQYSVTKETTSELATKTRDGAYDFVNQIDVLLDDIKDAVIVRGLQCDNVIFDWDVRRGFANDTIKYRKGACH